MYCCLVVLLYCYLLIRDSSIKFKFTSNEKAMINWNYLTNLAREHRGLLIFSFLFVALFQLLILTLITEADFMSIIEQVYARIPPQMQILFGDQFISQFSLNGIVGFGFNHPLILITIIMVAIILPARHLAGEVEEGTLELLLSMPVSRFTIAFSLWLFTAIALAWLVLGCWTGIGLGMILFPETHTLYRPGLLRSGFNLWLLMLTIGSYTFLISSFLKERGKASQRAAAITIFFYFLKFAVKIWSKIDFLEPFSVFNYYQPQELMMQKPLPIMHLAVLAALIILCSALAFRQVGRRDVPG